MDRRFEQRRTVALIARTGTRSVDLADPRALAWEILRRRGDYRAARAMTEWIGGTIRPIELIRPTEAPADWGLRFRRRS